MSKESQAVTIADPLDAMRCVADRIMCIVLIVHLIYCFAMAPWHDTYTAFFMVGLPTGLIGILLTWRLPGQVLTRMVVSVAFMVLSALAVHQARGMIEMHFGFFVLFAVLLFYRDWTVYLPAVAVAAVHHVSFNYLQQMNYGVYCFTRTGWDVVAIHVGYVLFAFVILVYMANMMRREAINADGLLRTSNQSNNVLTDLATNVRRVAWRITASVQQVAAGNIELSQRAEHQASQLEETAASMDQLTTTVKQNAENARQANVLAAGASEVAVKGGQVVEDVVQTMAGIETSSRKIADIISVINGIAFQTNILALNAAVEAARAGEQGRGFAVVASEVRSLAQRSAEAAKEIKNLIEDSVSKVGAGGKLVEVAGTTMREVVGSVKRVTDIIGQITVASQAQSAGIEQVNQAVLSLQHATQQNAAVVGNTSSAVESMREQMANLLKTTSRFDFVDKVPQEQERVDGPSATLAPREASMRRPTAGSTASGRLPGLAHALEDKEWKEF